MALLTQHFFRHYYYKGHLPKYSFEWLECCFSRRQQSLIVERFPTTMAMMAQWVVPTPRWTDWLSSRVDAQLQAVLLISMVIPATFGWGSGQADHAPILSNSKLEVFSGWRVGCYCQVSGRYLAFSRWPWLLSNAACIGSLFRRYCFGSFVLLLVWEILTLK